MPSVLLSDHIKNRRADPNAIGASEAVPMIAKYSLAAALVVNDVIEMLALPPGHQIMDGWVYVPDLDSNGSPSIVLRGGLLAGDVGDTTFANRTSGNAIGTELFSGSTVGQAGGLIRFSNAFMNLALSNARRGLGIQVSTAPATGATSGDIYMGVLLRPVFGGY